MTVVFFGIPDFWALDTDIGPGGLLYPPVTSGGINQLLKALVRPPAPVSLRGIQKKFVKFQVIIYILIVPTLGNPLIPTNKLSLATWGSYYQQDHMGPGTYAFGYDIEDPVTGNIQFKQEERHPNGTVTGNYGYVDADGKPHVVTYVSDENGYRAKLEVEGEPTRYFPDMSHFLGEQTTKGQQENGLEQKYNPLVVPLQGEDIQPDIPITHRLDYPSYYNHVGANAVSK